MIDFIKKRVASAREFLSRPSTIGGGADITDEAHAQADCTMLSCGEKQVGAHIRNH